MSLLKHTTSSNSSQSEENEELSLSINKDFSYEVKNIFTLNNANEVRVIEKNIRADVVNVTAEIHSAISDNFLKWLEAADSTKSLNFKIKSATDRLSELANSLKQYKKSLTHSSSNAESNKYILPTSKFDQKTSTNIEKKAELTEKYDRDQICCFAAQIKVLTDTNEQIWQNLDAKKFLQAAICFMRAEKIYFNLIAEFENKSTKFTLKQFPVIEQQWSIISRLQKQISLKCLQLISHNLLEKDVNEVANALCGLLIINRYNIDKLAEIFLLKLTQNIQKYMIDLFNSLDSNTQPDFAVYKFSSSSISMIQNAIIIFSKLFVSFSHNISNDSQQTNKNASLILQLLKAFFAKNSSLSLLGDDENFSKIIIEKKSIDSTGSNKSSFLNPQKSKSDLVGWVSRRRSSFVNDQNYLYSDDSSPGTGYTISKFLPDSIRFFFPELPFLNNQQFLEELQYEKFESDQVGKDRVHQSKYNSNFGLSDELNILIGNQFINWFDFALDSLKSHLSTILKKFAISTTQLVYIINMFVRLNFSDTSKEDSDLAKQINSNDWNNACNTFDAYKSFAPEFFQKIKIYRNLYLTELAPFFDKYVKNVLLEELTDATYTLPLQNMQIWADPSKIMAYDNISIDKIVWSSLNLGDQSKYEKKKSNGYSGEFILAEKTNLRNMIQSEKEIAQSLNPVVEEVRLVMDQLAERVIKSLEDTLYWNNFLMKTILIYDKEHIILQWENLKNFEIFFDFLAKTSKSLVDTIESKSNYQDDQNLNSSNDQITKSKGFLEHDTEIKSKLNFINNFSFILFGQFGSAIILFLKAENFQNLLLNINHLNKSLKNRIGINTNSLPESKISKDSDMQILEITGVLRNAWNIPFEILVEHWAGSFVSYIFNNFASIYGFFCKENCSYKELADETNLQNINQNKPSFKSTAMKCKQRDFLKKTASLYLSSITDSNPKISSDINYFRETKNVIDYDFSLLKSTVKSVMKLEKTTFNNQEFCPSSQVVEIVLNLVYEIHSKIFLYSVASNDVIDKLFALLSKKLSTLLDEELEKLVLRLPSECFSTGAHNLQLLVSDLVYLYSLIRTFKACAYYKNVDFADPNQLIYDNTTLFGILGLAFPKTCKYLDGIFKSQDKLTLDGLFTKVEIAEKYSENIRINLIRFKAMHDNKDAENDPVELDLSSFPFNLHFAIITTLIGKV
ncbi:hypothetical protein BB561_004744 [Smittium simulii]|uniref:Conserved oligomeric Golgi complex subunit 1 n=1 Tax=Smittium simulii TaxID=133385 RepID=A0A2T9YEM3_9FUNG|nr:hypothetical protein BB561_004744 [Smittium simulii]